MELDFEKLYKISLTAMRLNKIHPDIPRTKSWYIISAANQIIFTSVFYLVIQNMVLNARSGDILEACQFSILCMVYVLITVQKNTILANHNMLNRFIIKIKEDYAADWPDDEKMIILEHALKAKKVCVMWLFLATYAGGLFILKHIILEIYIYIEKGEFVLLEFYPAKYPWFIENYKFNPYVYTILYVVLVSFMTNSVMIYIAMAPFGPICILHACAQLAIAKKRIEDLDVTKVQEFEEKIKAIVQLLQKAYIFVDDINSVMGLIHEVIMRTNIFVLPLAWWIVRTGYDQGEVPAEFLSFVFGSILMCYVLCNYGQLLIETGNAVSFAIYSCGWEKTYNRNMRISVVMIMHRAQRTVAIRSIYHEFSMEAFSELIHQSYAFLNLINAMWK